jgi:hypothetical protein
MSNPIIFLSGEPIGIWLAAAAFGLGGVANATGLPKIRTSFTNLGFPGWWCWVTAVVEIVAALLLLVPASRFIGIALGGCVMAAAIVAILARRLYAHLLPPVVFVFLLALAGLSHSA